MVLEFYWSLVQAYGQRYLLGFCDLQITIMNNLVWLRFENEKNRSFIV